MLLLVTTCSSSLFHLFTIGREEWMSLSYPDCLCLTYIYIHFPSWLSFVFYLIFTFMLSRLHQIEPWYLNFLSSSIHFSLFWTLDSYSIWIIIISQLYSFQTPSLYCHLHSPSTTVSCTSYQTHLPAFTGHFFFYNCIKEVDFVTLCFRKGWSPVPRMELMMTTSSSSKSPCHLVVPVPSSHWHHLLRLDSI